MIFNPAMEYAFFFREYEKELDEEAAKRHFIRIKKSQIQKDITENQLEKHIIRMVCTRLFLLKPSICIKLCKV